MNEFGIERGAGGGQFLECTWGVGIATGDDASGGPRGFAAGLCAINDQTVSMATEVEGEGESDDSAADDDEVRGAHRKIVNLRICVASGIANYCFAESEVSPGSPVGAGRGLPGCAASPSFNFDITTRRSGAGPM